MYKYTFIFLIIAACAGSKPYYVDPESHINGLKIQPSEALRIASPQLASHGTYIYMNADKAETYIVRKGDNYYIKHSDFPAKSINWYLHQCLKINTDSGELTIIE